MNSGHPIHFHDEWLLYIYNASLNKLHEIAEVLKISEGGVFTILHKRLSMRKLCSKWVQCLLTVDKKQHVNNSECCLQLFQCNKKEFLHKYVTMDEIWIHCFTSETNRRSAELTAASETCLKQPKTQISAGKVLASGFCARYFVHQLPWERKNHR